MDEEAIFLEALRQETPQGRAAFLDGVCAGNEQLRRGVERLLEAHARAGEFLQRPPVGAAPTVDRHRTEGPGTVMGPCGLLQQVGERDMGTAWRAQQTLPVQRLVAVKVLKPGMDTRQVIARFEAERQALALMDHPNIARVFDAGTTEGGRPYFVMELVQG